MPKASIKSAREIACMRESCRIVAEVLRLLGSAIAPGVSTGELDRIAEEFIRSQDGTPAFKGYGPDRRNPFPTSICVSVDDEVVHGIPDGRVLEEWEIVAIDVGVKHNGYYGDGASTFAVGKVGEEKQRLMDVTREALYLGVAQAKAGRHVSDISSAVQKWVEGNGFSVVKELVGHGVGRNLHEAPAVPNFIAVGESGKGVRLRAGMTLAIEPMVNAGTDRIKVDADGWTVRTVDGKPSAHFEHTVLITEDEPEILTK
jgi:methionyl aminopeptidase